MVRKNQRRTGRFVQRIALVVSPPFEGCHSGELRTYYMFFSRFWRMGNT